MNDDVFREYRQDFALAVLLRNFRPMTAGDVAEHIAVLGPAEAHPDDCWRGASPAAIAGHLRALETRGLVQKDGERANVRAGRAEPMWRPVGEYNRTAPIPMAPLLDEEGVDDFALTPPAPLPDNPYENLSRPQLYTLLNVHDEISGACYRFLREMQDINERARRQLSQAGVEVPVA
ncbi:MAG: hypothetical protein ACREO4_06330 [Lysobacter sp.]